MRKIILFPLAAALGWAAMSAAAITQVPTVEVAAAPACGPDADDWAADLAGRGFDIVRRERPAGSVPCLAGRTAGFDLEGAVPPAAVERLVRKRPRGITGLAADPADPLAVATLNRDGTRSPFPYGTGGK